MRVPTIFCAALFATACATTKPITTGVITVDRPVAVRCVRAADIPPMPVPPTIAADADIEQLAAWAKLRIAQLRHHAAQLLAIVTACATED